MGWNPKKEAEKAARKVVDKVVKPAANAAKGELNRLGDEIRSSIRSRGNEVRGMVEQVADEGENRIRAVGHEVESGLTEKLPELVEGAIEDLAELAAQESIGEALDNAADVIEMMAPTRFTLIFGVELALVVQGEVTVAVALPNPAAKLTEIRQWAKNPPRGRAQIVECIQAFAPESLAVEAKMSGNGLAAEWDGDDKYDRIDAFLSKHGVD